MVFRQGTDGEGGVALNPTRSQFDGPARRLGQSRRSGVQGKALEYHIDSLPFGARSLSALHEADHPDYDVKRQDPIRVWIEYYYHLTPAEREKLLAFLMREGMSRLLQLIDAPASHVQLSPSGAQPPLCHRCSVA